MSAARVTPLVAIEEYLAFERAARERHEYLDGRLLAMAGESPAHGHITVNLVSSLTPQFNGTPCFAWTKDAKVRSGPSLKSRKSHKGLFSYPDIVVICGEPIFHDQHQDDLLNPRVIIEVLSESTEAFDRGEKFTRYQKWNPSLMEYVLVSQARPQVEQFIRQGDDSWSYYLHSGLNAEFRLSSIGCSLKLSEIFNRVSFAVEDEGEGE